MVLLALHKPVTNKVTNYALSEEIEADESYFG
jgi:hypothetical protein